MSVLRPRILALAAGFGALAVAAAVAAAQPSTGIVHAPGGSGQRQMRLGTGLFAANCASCHGSQGEGVC